MLFKCFTRVACSKIGTLTESENLPNSVQEELPVHKCRSSFNCCALGHGLDDDDIMNQ